MPSLPSCQDAHQEQAAVDSFFALDATASRQPIWDTACQLQAEMFRETGAIGGLSVQLVYYRGLTEERCWKRPISGHCNFQKHRNSRPPE
jgi:hypothetical protein